MANLSVARLIPRFEPLQLCPAWCIFIPDKPSVSRGPGPLLDCATRIEGDPLAEHLNTARRGPRENRIRAVRTLKKGEPKQKCELAARVLNTASNKAFSGIVGWVGDDVVGGAGRLQKIVTDLAVTPVIKVRASDGLNRLVQHARHRAVAACAFPDIPNEPFILDQSIGCPRWGWKKVWAIEIGEPFEGRLDATVDIVSCVHSKSGALL